MNQKEILIEKDISALMLYGMIILDGRHKTWNKKARHVCAGLVPEFQGLNQAAGNEIILQFTFFIPLSSAGHLQGLRQFCTSLIVTLSSGRVAITAPTC